METNAPKLYFPSDKTCVAERLQNVAACVLYLCSVAALVVLLVLLPGRHLGPILAVLTVVVGTVSGRRLSTSCSPS